MPPVDNDVRNGNSDRKGMLANEPDRQAGKREGK